MFKNRKLIKALYVFKWKQADLYQGGFEFFMFNKIALIYYFHVKRFILHYDSLLLRNSKLNEYFCIC